MEVLTRAGYDGLRAAGLARLTGVEEKKLCKYDLRLRREVVASLKEPVGRICEA